MPSAAPWDVAAHVVTESFPTCQMALLAGSVAREEHHEGSDLDVVIIDATATPHWETQIIEGWPVEVFVFTPATLDAVFALDVQRRWPLHLTMCREGRVLWDPTGRAAEMQGRADRILAEGPAPLTPEEVAQKRYDLTWRLDDLNDATATMECTLIGHDLVLEAADMHLVFQRFWRGRGGKWTQRMLEQADPAMARQFVEALIALHEGYDPRPALAFGDAVLAELGGRQFAGQYDAYSF